MSVIVNQELCIGCGACVAICPEGFKMNDLGKSEVVSGDAKCASEAAAGCPVQAITVA